MDVLSASGQNQSDMVKEEDGSSPAAAHHPDGSADGQRDVPQQRAGCWEGCLPFHSSRTTQGAHAGCRAQAGPADSPGRKLTRSRLPPGTTAGVLLVHGPGLTWGGGPASRAAVVGTPGGTPGSTWVGTRGAARHHCWGEAVA